MITAAAPPSLACSTLAEELWQQDAGQDDRRQSPRRNFGRWQMVAEFDGETLPAQEDFHLRFCQDISAGGISFLAEDRPASDDLVIALGVIPFVFFHVQFVRSFRRKDLEGSPLQIGCQFVRRLPA